MLKGEKDGRAWKFVHLVAVSSRERPNMDTYKTDDAKYLTQSDQVLASEIDKLAENISRCFKDNSQPYDTQTLP